MLLYIYYYYSYYNYSCTPPKCTQTNKILNTAYTDT